MSTSDPEAKQRKNRAFERRRDFLVLSAVPALLLTILAVSGALGWVEAITAGAIVGLTAIAFYVGTTPPAQRRTAARAELAEPSSDANDLAPLIEAFPGPAFHLDEQLRLRTHNVAAERIFRMTPDPAAHASVLVRDPDLLAAVEAAAAGPPLEAATLDFTPGELEAWRVRILRLPPPFEGVLAAFEDQSAATRAERARADLLANASHELRTPLTSLSGFIETMRGPAKDDPASWGRFLEIMHRQADRMQRLIDDLMSLSRIEVSRHRAPDAEVDLTALLGEVTASFEPAAAERGVALEVLPCAEAPVMVLAMADEIAQVAQNLIDNALKYAGAGGRVRVSFGVSPDDDLARREAGRRWEDAGRMTIFTPPARAGATAWLRVSDTGPGIERRHLSRLGERFYRVDESRGGEISGTGLGLAIVKHIMARHRGGLSVESRPGRGSAFGVWLPAAELAEAVAASNRDAAAVS